jgi:cytidine deaminase
MKSVNTLSQPLQTAQYEQPYLPIQIKSTPAATLKALSRGLGTCAERNAVVSAVSDGEYKFEAVAVVGEGDEPITPCGACRHILAEFAEVAQHDIMIIMRGQNGETRVESLEDMIPDIFGTVEAGADLQEYR